MEQFSNSIVDISYQQTGAATAVNTLGMREMQALAYEARDKKFLLIKAPPASGKSRALMFIALDKLVNQGIKKVVVAVPEKSIGRSFKIRYWRLTSFTTPAQMPTQILVMWFAE